MPQPVSLSDAGDDLAIRVRDLTVAFDGKPVIDHLDLDLRQGEILGLIGASGSGKSVLMRAILGLLPRTSGTVEILGQDIDALPDADRARLEQRCGVMFQQGALFSSLTILDNVALPMREVAHLPAHLIEAMSKVKLSLVGLPGDAAAKFPSQLSGGMTKRAALARALALDPEILFLDEPTSGLDPIAADGFDQLLLTLRDSLNLSVMMVTHDLSSLHATCDRIAAIARGRIVAIGTLPDLLAHDDPWLQSYFSGERGKTIFSGPRVSHAQPCPPGCPVNT